jgi:hypothetical protein
MAGRTATATTAATSGGVHSTPPRRSLNPTPPSPSMGPLELPSPSVSRRRPSESEGAGIDFDLRPSASGTAPPPGGHMVTCHPHSMYFSLRSFFVQFLYTFGCCPSVGTTYWSSLFTMSPMCCGIGRSSPLCMLYVTYARRGR